MEQYENIALGPRYALKLEQLRDWHVLRATCWHCRHTGVVHPVELRRRFPEHSRLNELEARLVCTRCGNRANNSWETCRLPRD